MNRLVFYFKCFKAVLPKSKAVFRDSITNFSGHACTDTAFLNTFPREESKNRTRRAYFITKVKVIGTWIIKIDGLLHQSHTKDPGIKIKISLCITSNSCNMM